MTLKPFFSIDDRSLNEIFRWVTTYNCELRKRPFDWFNTLHSLRRDQIIIVFRSQISCDDGAWLDFKPNYVFLFSCGLAVLYLHV